MCVFSRYWPPFLWCWPPRRGHGFQRAVPVCLQTGSSSTLQRYYFFFLIDSPYLWVAFHKYGPSFRIKATEKWMKERKQKQISEKWIPLQPGLCLFTFQWQNCSLFGGNIQLGLLDNVEKSNNCRLYWQRRGILIEGPGCDGYQCHLLLERDALSGGLETVVEWDNQRVRLALV